MNASYYPWLEPYWNKLHEYKRQNAFPNALLIVGKQGFGYEALVQLFANSVCCTNTNSDELACGECNACQMFNSGSYPDFKYIKPEEGESTIKILPVRQLIKSLSLSRQYDKQRIIMISPVDEMLYQASNSLLKTLEEPNEGTTLILIAHDLAKVPATIRSRCQLISSYLSSSVSMLSWLEEQGCQQSQAYLNLANGSPLYAKQLWSNNAVDTRNEVFEMFLGVVNQKIDPLAFSERCFKLKEYPLSTWISSWLADAIVLSSTKSTESLTNTDLTSNLKILINTLHLRKLFALLDEILEISKFEAGQVNQQLLLDKFAINCFAKD
jgi:DNA polymerase-3 subunit delta'